MYIHIKRPQIAKAMAHSVVWNVMKKTNHTNSTQIKWIYILYVWYILRGQLGYGLT